MVSPAPVGTPGRALLARVTRTIYSSDRAPMAWGGGTHRARAVLCPLPWVSVSQTCTALSPWVLPLQWDRGMGALTGMAEGTRTCMDRDTHGQGHPRTGTPIHRDTHGQGHQSTGTPRTGTPTDRDTHRQGHQSTGTLTDRDTHGKGHAYTGTPIYRDTNPQGHAWTGTRQHRHTQTQGHPRTGTSIYKNSNPQGAPMGRVTHSW